MWERLSVHMHYGLRRIFWTLRNLRKNQTTNHLLHTHDQYLSWHHVGWTLSQSLTYKTCFSVMCFTCFSITNKALNWELPIATYLISKAGSYSGRNAFIQIGIVKDDGWVLASKLQRKLLAKLGTPFNDTLPSKRASSEGNQWHLRVGD